MKEIKYVQPAKHPQETYIQAQAKTFCIIQNTYTMSTISSIQNSGVGGGGHVNVCSTCPARQTTTKCVYSGTNLTMCITQNKYTRSSTLSKQIRGWGTTAFPVVIATGSRGHPIGSPSEHHRDPIVILLNPSTTWGTKRLKWESNKHPMGILW